MAFLVLDAPGRPGKPAHSIHLNSSTVAPHLQDRRQFGHNNDFTFTEREFDFGASKVRISRKGSHRRPDQALYLANRGLRYAHMSIRDVKAVLLDVV